MEQLYMQPHTRHSMSEQKTIYPSRSWYQFINLEKMADLVSPEHVECYRGLSSVPPDCKSDELTTTLLSLMEVFHYKPRVMQVK